MREIKVAFIRARLAGVGRRGLASLTLLAAAGRQAGTARIARLFGRLIARLAICRVVGLAARFTPGRIFVGQLVAADLVARLPLARSRAVAVAAFGRIAGLLLRGNLVAGLRAGLAGTTHGRLCAAAFGIGARARRALAGILRLLAAPLAAAATLVAVDSLAVLRLFLAAAGRHRVIFLFRAAAGFGRLWTSLVVALRFGAARWALRTVTRTGRLVRLRHLAFTAIGLVGLAARRIVLWVRRSLLRLFSASVLRLGARVAALRCTGIRLRRRITLLGLRTGVGLRVVARLRRVGLAAGLIGLRLAAVALGIGLAAGIGLAGAVLVAFLALGAGLRCALRVAAGLFARLAAGLFRIGPIGRVALARLRAGRVAALGLLAVVRLWPAFGLLAGLLRLAAVVRLVAVLWRVAGVVLLGAAGLRFVAVILRPVGLILLAIGIVLLPVGFVRLLLAAGLGLLAVGLLGLGLCLSTLARLLVRFRAGVGRLAFRPLLPVESLDCSPGFRS